VWATSGYERVPFMWAQDSDRAFMSAITAQLEGFVRAVTGGGQPEGAGGEDAVAALAVAEAVAAALTAADARVTA
jgi:predicted dehydrogenase